ncbi:hypothetical protein KAW38_00355 [Candidatus Micrarchaeota archaeon]|nr:hypothetical protein [Candidatus Micrarchaeota archaeon]
MEKINWSALLKASLIIPVIYLVSLLIFNFSIEVLTEDGSLYSMFSGMEILLIIIRTIGTISLLLNTLLLFLVLVLPAFFYFKLSGAGGWISGGLSAVLSIILMFVINTFDAGINLVSASDLMYGLLALLGISFLGFVLGGFTGTLIDYMK